MKQFNNPAPTPRYATKATEEQRRLQEKLDNQSDDPDAPGRHQDGDQLAQES